MRKILFLALGIFVLVRFSRSCPGTSRSRSVGGLFLFSRRIQQRSERQRRNCRSHRVRQPLAGHYRRFRRVPRFPVWRQRQHVHVPGWTACRVPAFRTGCAVRSGSGWRGSSHSRREWDLRLDKWICLECRRRNRPGAESSPGIPSAV